MSRFLWALTFCCLRATGPLCCELFWVDVRFSGELGLGEISLRCVVATVSTAQIWCRGESGPGARLMAFMLWGSMLCFQPSCGSPGNVPSSALVLSSPCPWKCKPWSWTILGLGHLASISLHFFVESKWVWSPGRCWMPTGSDTVDGTASSSGQTFQSTPVLICQL